MLSAEEQETWLALGPFQGACQEARGPRRWRQDYPYLWCLRPQWWCWCSLKIPARKNMGGGEACLTSRKRCVQWGLPRLPDAAARFL